MSGNDGKPALGRDRRGSATVQLALIAPLFLALLFAIIEFALALHQWNAAAKATHFGARAAVVAAPVASGINQTAWDFAFSGEWCRDPDTGVVQTALCPQSTSVCSRSGGTGACTNGFAFDAAAWDSILGRMRLAWPGLPEDTVRLRYETNGLGFVASPFGQGVTVTVELQCAGFDFIVVQAVIDLLPIPADGACAEAPPGIPMPHFASALTGEDLAAN